MKYEKIISRQRGWKLSFEFHYEDFLKFLEESKYKLYILGSNPLEVKLHEDMLKKTVETATCEFIDCKIFGVENKALSYISADEPWDYAADKLREFTVDYPIWFVLEDWGHSEFACNICGELLEEDDDHPNYPTYEKYGHKFVLCKPCIEKYFEPEKSSDDEPY